jgi:hypothetical protein
VPPQLGRVTINALVNRVKRRIGIPMVRFARSTEDVETCLASGLPVISCFREPMHLAGL